VQLDPGAMGEWRERNRGGEAGTVTVTAGERLAGQLHGCISSIDHSSRDWVSNGKGAGNGEVIPLVRDLAGTGNLPHIVVVV